LKIAYFALAVDLSQDHGGTTHVLEVCRGLEALGHEIWVVGSSPSNALPSWVKRIEIGRRPWVYLRSWRSAKIALSELKPDAVMERYYNFSGQGVYWASRMGIRSILEVNAPMVAAPGTTKQLLDALTLRQLISRLALLQAQRASAIVTPLATTVPWRNFAGKVVELPWGANTEAFHPGLKQHPEAVSLRDTLGITATDRVVVFHGSFRPWHGVDLLADTIPMLLDLDRRYKVLLIGDGERLEAVRHKLAPLIRQSRVIVTGRVPYSQVPLYLAAGHVAVAPFDPAKHPYLRHFGFYWSPLKVFEAMAAGLSVVTARVHPLSSLVRDGKEGFLFKPGSRAELLNALQRLLADPELSEELGARARERVVQDFSWQRHCAQLDRLLQELAG
jgi:glycosyltransferase involved in cell wall biosynthesis